LTKVTNRDTFVNKLSDEAIRHKLHGTSPELFGPVHGIIL